MSVQAYDTTFSGARASERTGLLDEEPEDPKAEVTESAQRSQLTNSEHRRMKAEVDGFAQKSQLTNSENSGVQTLGN